MQTIGLLGGMSWVSTELYYRQINKTIAERLGGSHSAKILMQSFDFAEIEALQVAGDWNAQAQALGDASRRLKTAGADFAVIASNTLHVVAEEVERLGGLPLLHIGDATADALKRAKIHRVGLLGTRYTMEKPFLRERLERHGIQVMIPDEEDRTTIHDVIYDELIKDVVEETSRTRYLEIVERLRASGAQGIILGCTEIELLITPDSTDMPLFATAALHAVAAADRALASR